MIAKYKILQRWLENLTPYLIAIGIGTLPLKANIPNTISYVLVLTWFLTGDFQRKYKEIVSNPVAWVPVVYFAWSLIAMLWTEDTQFGLRVLNVSRRLLFIPFFLTQVRQKDAQMALWALFAGTLTAVLLAFGLLTGLTPLSFHHGSGLPPRRDLCVFTDHCSYTPILAWVLYSALAVIQFGSKTKKIKVTLTLFSILIAINIFMTEGVTGYAACFALIALFILQSIPSPRKALSICVALALLLPCLLWVVSPPFKTRLKQNYREMTSVIGTPKDQGFSIGPRLFMWKNTIEIIQDFPVFGIGTGDFPKEYGRRFNTRFGSLTSCHNEYLQAWAQTGIIGLVLLVSIFLAQLFYGLRSQSWLAPLQVALPCFFLLIMLSDGHPFVSRLAMLHLFMSASLYSKR